MKTFEEFIDEGIDILKKKKIKPAHPGYGTEEGVDEGIMDTAGFHNYPKRNKVGDEIEKIASKGGKDEFNLSKVASELQKGRIPHKVIKKLSPKSKKAVHAIMKDFGWKELPEIAPVIGIVGKAIGGAAKAAVATPVRRAITRTVAKKIHKKVTDKPEQDSTSEGIFGSTTAKKTRDKMFLARSRANTIKKEKPVNESKGLQAQMALDDARIKFKMEDGKIYVDKKDVMKAEKALAKSFKTKPTSLDGKKFPAIYYHGGSLGIWNKKRPITGMGR